MEAVLYTCDYCKVSARALTDAKLDYIPMGWRVLASRQQDQLIRYEGPGDGFDTRSLMCEDCYLKTKAFWVTLGPEVDAPKRRRFDLS